MKSKGLCFDRVIPEAYHPARKEAERALRAGLRSVNPAVFRMALPTLKMWQNGRTLRCTFLDGSTNMMQRVEQIAHTWEEFANIRLQFVGSGDAEIRISFYADAGSWSAVGNDALVETYFPKYQPTMNYGWLRDDTDETEYRRVVLHEFGHALGCIHEHQSPAANLRWNKTEVYRVFSGPPNYWSKAEIDHNILDKYNGMVTNSEFDPQSIMLYSFPDNLFEGGEGTANNTDLSERDKQFISQKYPKG